MSQSPIPYQQDPAQYINGGVADLLFSSATAVGNTADTNEDILHSYSLPAGFLLPSQTTAQITPPQPLKGIKYRAWGLTVNNGDTKTLKFYFGGTSFSASLTTSSAAAWVAEMEVIRKDNTHQVARFLCIHGTSIIACSQSTSVAEDLTGAVTIKSTATASVGNANDIVENGALVEFWV